MKEFTKQERKDVLANDSLRAAARDVKALEKGPAWLRICQELEADRERYHQILYIKARTVAPADYAEASGALGMIERFYRILDSIKEDGKEDSE